MRLIIRKLSYFKLQYWLSVILAMFFLISCASTPSNEPKQDEAYVRQSIEYMRAERLDAALASISKAIQLNPKSADAYTVAGLIYNKNYQSDLAERYFKRALTIEPDHSAAQTNYASFLCKHDQPLEAEKMFISAAKNDKNNQPALAYTNAGLCVLGIPDTVKASDYFKQALKIKPRSPVPLYQLAKIQYGNYEYAKALEFLQAYENIARPTPKTLLLGAQIAEANKDAKLANQYKLALAQQFPNSAEAKQLTGTPKQEPAVFDARDFVEEDSSN